MSGGLFFGINIALKGMMAQQSSLNVTSHNISNANTPGFTRQNAVLETSIPISGLTHGAGQLGSGVEVTEIRRIRENFVDYQIRNESSKQGTWEGINDTLQQVEIVFMEPSESGLNQLMDRFWSDWQELSKYPESSPIRTALKEDAVSLASSLRHIHTQLTELKTDIQGKIDIKTKEVNTMGRQIARLNEQIVNVKLAGDNPNDMLDQRDVLLDKISKLTDINITRLTNVNGDYSGAVKVDVGGTNLVDGENYTEISGIASTHGEIAGLETVRSDDGSNANTIQYYLDKIDTMAAGMASVINEIHESGYALDGTQGENFFIFQDESGNEIDPESGDVSAASIYVNPSITSDVSKIAAGQRIEVGIYKESTAELPPEADNIFDQFNTELTSRGIVATDTISFEIHSEYLDSDENLQIFDETFSFQPGSISLIDIAEDINSRNMGLTANYDSENNNFSLTTDNQGSDVKLEVTNDDDNFISNDGDDSILKLEMDTAAEYTGEEELFLKGNGDTAAQIAALKNASLAYDQENKILARDESGGTNFADFYKNMVAEVGVATQESGRMAENQEILAGHLERRRESISGVSLDEEMANMVRFQHAFQANAKVISVMDELLNTVVNGLKR